MPTYIGFLKLTDQGMRNLKDRVAAQNTNLGGASCAEAGGRIIGVWWTHGAYDLVVVGEWPDDEAVSVTAFAIQMRGNLRGEITRAFTPQEMQGIVQRLP